MFKILLTNCIGQAHQADFLVFTIYSYYSEHYFDTPAQSTQLPDSSVIVPSQHPMSNSQLKVFRCINHAIYYMCLVPNAVIPATVFCNRNARLCNEFGKRKVVNEDDLQSLAGKG